MHCALAFRAREGVLGGARRILSRTCGGAGAGAGARDSRARARLREEFYKKVRGKISLRVRACTPTRDWYEWYLSAFKIVGICEIDLLLTLLSAILFVSGKRPD